METKNEIFSQRLVKAVLWNIVLQTVLATGLVFVIQVDPLHPVSWLVSTFHDIFSWKMGLNVVLLSLVSFFQAYVYGTYYTVQQPKYFTRFSMFFNMFTLQNIVFGILYSLNGYFSINLYTSLADSKFNTLKKACEKYDGQCLSEQSLLLQFGGMWMGMYYFLSVHILGTTVLTFPHIYQDKLQQIKLVISHIISSGFRKSIMPVVYFCLFYNLWGNKSRNIVSDVYSLYLEDPPLDNFLNLFMSGIYIGLWFYTSLFFISVFTMRTVFNIVLTEPMKFPIESETKLTLCNALAQTSKFNRYLAALDLKRLAMNDACRRSDIFTLSQPGGHPRNWNNLLDKCLGIINEFNKELENINGDGSNGEVDSSYNIQMKKSNVSDIPPMSSSMYSSPLRNMAYSPKLFELKDHKQHATDNAFTNVVKTEFNNFIQKLCQKPGISYFFGELTDTRLKFLLIQSQPVIWTCEGLATIVAASLKEDKYGIVQTDIPEVITSLVNLKQNLDKLTKPGLVPKKHFVNDEFALRLRTALLSALKRSLYKIVITFSKHIHEIPLEHDIQVALQPFLFCKEP
ncbi:PREDICTED: nucleoporin NDC1-like [Papilio xuthus]|uniref:Nucleoporin NDC1-like n=1 Tax=Papilio xuthus TaxID=66420 RepID=A0AAJ7EED2_PAPXU|nr:PREDICTED: nucleoporin NDC1-like [Papilio xuthus]